MIILINADIDPNIWTANSQTGYKTDVIDNILTDFVLNDNNRR